MILIGYGIYSFLANNENVETTQNRDIHTNPIWGIIAGFCAGILGGAYNANGPPVIIYASITQKDKGAFRSILQAFFLINGFVIIAGHTFFGLITKQVLYYSLWGLPGLLLGMLLGFYIDRFLTPHRFRKLVIAGIILLGTGLLIPTFIPYLF